MVMSFKALCACSLLGFGALLATQTSCVDNNKSMFIRQVQKATAPACTIEADETALFVTSGMVDVGLANSYSVAALVGSQLVSRANTRTSASEPNRVLLEYADIRLRINGAERWHFSVGINGAIDPTPDAKASYGLANVQVIPPSIMQELLLETIQNLASLALTAEFSVVGRTLAGDRIESSEYTFPVTVCYGCLVSFPASANDPSLGYPNCAAASSSTSTDDEEQACSAGANDPISCRMCQSLPACITCEQDAHCRGTGRCDTRIGRCVPAF